MFPQGEGFDEAWSQLFFNLDLVRHLKTDVTESDTANQLITAGASWDGAGWTTSRASLKVFGLTGVTVVKKEFQEYRNSFLFALCMLLDIEVPVLELSESAAEAAFAFVGLLAARGTTEGRAQDSAKDEPMAEAEEDHSLEWDEQCVLLPPDLLTIWSGVQSGERKLDLSAVLAQVPKFEGLPTKAAENNHRQDGKQVQDRALKSYQQTILHIARLLTTAYVGGPNCKVQYQQGFQLLAELFAKLQMARKEASIPGSVYPVCQ